MARPRTYDDALRDGLIDAAAASIASGGVERLSLRETAAQASTSTNAVYTLFGSKEDLVAAVVAKASASFTAAQRAVSPSDDVMADLMGLGHAYRAWVLDHPALYGVLMGGRVPLPGLSGSGWLDDPACRPLLDGVRRAVTDGVLTGEPEQIAITLWAGVHGMVTLETALWSGLARTDRERRFEEHLVSLACRWVS